MNILDELFKQKGWVRTAIYVLAGLFVALIIFEAGMSIGYRRATFSYGTGAAYYRVFERPDGFEPHEPGEVHGAAGKIVSINVPTFVVASNDNTEKIVLIGDDTGIRKFHDAATSSDLNVGDFVVVIGEPNDKAQIQAQLIRILPPPPSAQ